MNRSWITLATLAICFFSGAVQLHWGGQDRQGQFHAEYLLANGGLGMSLFFLGPYFLLTMSAFIAWRQRASQAILMLTAALCGISASWPHGSITISIYAHHQGEGLPR